MSVVGYCNGYSVHDNRSEVPIVTYRVPGRREVMLPVRKSVAPLLINAARDWNRYVEWLKPGWCWGYAYRQVTGGNSWSWHAAGIAIDLNAPAHPYGQRGTFTPIQEYMGRAIARKYGLRWGEDYRSNADGMHLEVILKPSEAHERIHELRDGGMRAPIIPFPGTMQRGDDGFAVRVVQRALRRRNLATNPRVDGKFGRQTERAVKEFEAKIGVREDGTVGPKVWRRLF